MLRMDISFRNFFQLTRIEGILVGEWLFCWSSLLLLAAAVANWDGVAAATTTVATATATAITAVATVATAATTRLY